MKEKFSVLLDSGAWKVIFNDNIYHSDKVKIILSNIIMNWQVNQIEIDKNRYVIAVGFNGFDYFIYYLLASILGIKLIICDPKMLSTLIAQYQLPFQYVISTKQMETGHVPLLKIEFNYYCNQSPFFLPTHFNQAELIFFTSGTTNMPKLVVYEENSLLQNCKAVGNYLGIEAGDKCLCLFPTNYMYGFSMLMTTIMRSGTVILERSTITAQEILAYLLNENIKILPIIHSVINKVISLIEDKSGDQHFFKKLIIMNASDKIYTEDVKRILKICPIFWNNFGQTESGPRIFSLKIIEQDDIAIYSHKSVMALGKTIDEKIELRIVNEQGLVCADNEIGELHYHSPYAMKGYLDIQGKLTTKDFIASGDLVYKNAQGYVFWVGRKNETIKLNGKFVNISLLHTYFDKLNIVKKSYFVIDQEKQALNAIFIPTQNKNKTKLEADLIKHYQHLFPNYPRIKNILFVEEIPTTLSGKVKLRELNDLFL